MITKKPSHALVAAAIALAAVGATMTPAPVQAQAVRPEVGRPLQAAQELIRKQRFREALAKVRDAEKVSGRTAGENALIERMRLAAASGAGDADTAARAFDALGAQLAGAERLRAMESIAGGYYRAKDYAEAVHWGQRYFRDGGTSDAVQTLLVQSQYLAGDFAGAARALRTAAEQSEKAGRTPDEERLQLLANAALKGGDTAGYVWALERLLAHHPKPAYWTDRLARLRRQPGFSDRLALDVYRLSLATGSMGSATDFMEMAQLALQAGSPAEARRVMDRGFSAGVLGQGAEAERHQRLLALVDRQLEEARRNRTARLAEAQAARDGRALIDAGLDMVFAGEATRGLQLMQQGLAKGQLKRPDDAKLHLAVAQLAAGDATAAQATLRTVAGRDGTADLARLWSLHARQRR